MLISPAEPPTLKRLGRSSPVPETVGADFLISSPLGLVGVQRKELSDLVASLHDDRLAREIIQLRELDHAVWLIEGTPRWNCDGQALWTRTKYTKVQHAGLTFSLAFQGFSIFTSSSLTESGEWLSALNRWLTKETHSHLNHRSSARGVFGKPDRREWQIHFLQGLPGLGYERARAAVDHFGGLPLALTGDLAEVAGIGKQTAKRIGEIFNV